MKKILSLYNVQMDYLSIDNDKLNKSGNKK